jgi:hypothetical protein
LEIIFPDGYREADLGQLNYRGLKDAIGQFPMLEDALEWAGWTVPG